ncbi:MAG: asparagine synthase B [Armatimonadota bacterium]|nr:MAG: asparagine synthase B [Armatimonadota bacterium]
MCGFVGYFGDARMDLQRALTQILHRGPDGKGVAYKREGAVAHARLAILDIQSGKQPMQDESGRIIAYNGEVYNHTYLRQSAVADGRFQTHTDTETILRLYAKFGTKTPQLLDGMFAFAIIDGGDLFLARDPVGIKPLYFTSNNGTLYFASEIKALVGTGSGIHPIPPGWCYHSKQGWHEFAKIGDTHAFPPVEQESVDWHYWMQRNFTRDEALQAIRAVLLDAVVKRLMSDVPVGVSLSGGLDSTIVCALAKSGLERIESFSVGVKGSKDQEAAYAASRFLGTSHHDMEYTLEDMLKVLPEVLYYLESFDPALVRSAIPNYLLARLASQHVRVILTGEGADELYAGYDYLRQITNPAELRGELELITRALHNTNLQRADRMSMAFGLEARVPFLDLRSIALAWLIPAEWKRTEQGQIEKALLREAFAHLIPQDIALRPKQKFSAGAGSSELMKQYAEQTISDTEYERERERLQREWNYTLAGKEALLYYRIMREFYEDEHILPHMGTSRSL